MFNTLRFRLVASYALVILVLLLFMGLGWLIFLRTSGVIERFESLRLNSHAREALIEVPAPSVQRDQPIRAQVATWVIDLAEYSGYRVLFYAPQQQLLVDSAVLHGTAPANDFNLSDLPGQGQAGGSGPGNDSGSPPRPTGPQPPNQQLIRDSHGRQWLVVVIPIREGMFVGFLQRRTQPLSFLIDNLLLPLLQAGLLGILIALLFTGMIARWILRPVQQLVVAAGAIAEGDLDQRVPVTGPAEFQSLGRTFNHMVAQVNNAQQAQRDFVANVSHELRTPLTSIQGFSMAILDGTVEDMTSTYRAAQIINEEASRMERLVTELLDLARFDAGQSRLHLLSADLGVILNAVADKLEPQAKKRGLQLVRQIEALPLLKVDGDRMAQIFTNLLDNAFKYTPPEGTVKLAASVDGDMAVVTVEDNGQGIPPGDLPRIFERFYMADKSRKARKGYGVGLAITRELVEAHGGTISVESTPDVGTCFEVRLPIR